MKKILFIVNVDWFFISHRLPIALRAINEGYEVHIATKTTNKLNELKDNGIIVHPLNFHRSKKSPLLILIEFWKTYSIIKLVNPDILHLVTIKPVLLGGIASRLAGVSSVVFAISGLGHVFSKKGITGFLQRKISSLMYFFALGHKNPHIIFQNSSDKSKLFRSAKVDIQKSSIINGSGIDLTKFKRKPFPKGNPVVLFASRLIADKGVREFVDAAKVLKENGVNARFQIAGEPDKLNPSSITDEELDSWRKGNHIELFGFCKDMSSLISSSTIIVFPSYYGEGLPKILIEAAACGRPVITTDHPGCRDAIKNNISGLLVQARSVEQLSEAIVKLIKNPSLCERMGAEGRVLAEQRFDINSVITKHLNIYKTLHERVN